MTVKLFDKMPGGSDVLNVTIGVKPGITVELLAFRTAMYRIWASDRKGKMRMFCREHLMWKPG
jgi:hypothetical protein